MDYRKTMLRFSEALGKVNASYAMIAQKYEMTYNLLMVFYIIDEWENITQRDVCDKLYLSKSTVNSMLNDLRKQGYVELIPGRNKKEKFIVFTDKGRELNESIQKDTDRFEGKVLEWFGVDNSIEFLEHAEKLSDRMFQMAAEVISE